MYIYMAAMIFPFCILASNNHFHSFKYSYPLCECIPPRKVRKMSIPSMLPIINSIIGSSSISKTVVVSVTIFVALLCVCIVIGHLLEENRWTNESIISLLLGLATGGVLLLTGKGQNSEILSFDEDLFFIYLLPPIIFNAGFQVKKKQFFKNISIILLFGVFGTIISFCVITVGALVLFKRIGVRTLGIKDYLAIGSILSATDSVCTLQVLNQDETPLLYSIVFGEGVVNDATSIVLFNSVQSLDFSDLNVMTALKLLGKFVYLYLTSTAIGIAVGLLSAFGIKTLYFGRHSTDREVAIMLLMAYLSYMLAELLSLSGILTIFFCGIVMSHYTWHNVTESSRVTTKHAFATISFISETFIFLYVGMDALDVQKWKLSNKSAGTSIAISSTMFALVLVGRAAFVFPISNILNCTKGDDAKIKMRKQFIVWWAGLMRGAVTIALSYNQFSENGESFSAEQALMITSIIIVVLFSTAVCGSVTKPLIEAVLLKDKKGVTADATDFDSLEDLRILFMESGSPVESSSNQAGSRRNSFLMLMRYPTHTVHYFWRKFDDRFMRPVFGGRGFVPCVPGSPNSASG